MKRHKRICHPAGFCLDLRVQPGVQNKPKRPWYGFCNQAPSKTRATLPNVAAGRFYDSQNNLHCPKSKVLT